MATKKNEPETPVEEFGAIVEIKLKSDANSMFFRCETESEARAMMDGILNNFENCGYWTSQRLDPTGCPIIISTDGIEFIRVHRVAPTAPADVNPAE